MAANTLGIDFGTSNSAAGVSVNGHPYLIEIETGEQTLPTAVFFDSETRSIRYGSAANAALISGSEGRYMRALKSVLGTSLMHEPRRMLNETVTFVDIISRFLKTLKDKAEATCHQTFDTALSGRPVHFHSVDPAKDTQALADLTECYMKAGFKDVQFMFEPEAAAFASPPPASYPSVGLIVDIGGGTSDFTLFRHTTPGQPPEVLASHGVRIGGTNFDKLISVDHVMPLLGHGSTLRREMGTGLLPAPNALYQELATWEKIPFLYTGETRRKVKDMERLASTPELFARLRTVLELELGHEMAFAVERGKIQVNDPNTEQSAIDLRFIEKTLRSEITTPEVAATLDPLSTAIRKSAADTLAMAGLSAEQVDRVIFVGGSSLMSVVRDAIYTLCPEAAVEDGKAFTAIADGLALAAAEAF
ncbi:MAG: Hsp70 family protein [Pseudoruegeria sp.]